MKSTLIVGDTLEFTTAVPDYPASAGWTLTYRLVPRTSGSAISFNASASGDDYLVQVGSTTTAAWAAGEYSWSAYVTKVTERHTVDSGICTLLPDPSLVAAQDKRGHARKVLDAIEAVIENRATLDQEEYAIAGRSLKRTPLPELLKLRQLYKSEVAAEDAAEKLAAGIATPRKIQVRL